MMPAEAEQQSDRDGAIGTSALMLSLAAIALLALGLPFGAVRALHNRRLDAADADLATLAARLRDDRARWPSSVAILVGPGVAPRSSDLLWTTGATYPLSAIEHSARPDPWGGAYVVNIGASATAGAPVWVLSAGPDGTIATPFHAASPQQTVAGDDRAVRLR
jgi:hypothetical protein